MTYSSVSHWNVTEWSDEMEATARDKFIPMIMSVGAARVQMIRTGDLSFCVVTEYSDSAAGAAAQTKIAAIRGQASEELTMTIASAASGTVFAKG